MLKEHTVHFVIMAGGSGKRLWPLSRSLKPKQFIKLNNEKTLLQETIDRVKNIFDNQKISVVTTKVFENLVKNIAGNCIDQIIIEPEAKNTASAVLYSCLSLNCDPDDIIIFLPSDHHITNIEKFRDSILESVKAAIENENIVLIGIQPTYPATGYGYISIRNSIYKKYFEVEKFHEKPDIKLAQEYCNDKNMLWNSGIVCSKLSVLLDSYKNLFPEIKRKFDENIFIHIDLYKILPETSFDYAILEKSKNLKVVMGDFNWSDIGTLDLFIAAKKDLYNQENFISIESKNNLIEVQDKLVVLIGVNDFCIVQTDDVLFISSKKDIDKIKDVVNELKNSGKNKYC